MDRFSRGPVGNSGSDNYGGLSRSSAGIQTFMAQVYGWMASGLFVTAVVSYFVSNSFTLLKMAYSFPLGFFIAQLALVWIISRSINSISAGLATGLFMIYSAVTGIMLAPIFLIYTSSSLASVFAITAGTFGAMSIYGYSTKKDLSSWGSYLMMALIGFIIATVVNVFFLKNTGLAMALPYVGVLVFVGLTIYDTNTLRRMGEELEGNEEAIRRYSIVGALRLYLDFINLFILLLRLLGNRR
jgi:Integral membrane protein, interacts with FtsH